MYKVELDTLDLAYELRRLSNSVIKGIKQESELSCISSLTAIRPLVELILKTVTDELNVNHVVVQDKDSASFPIGFCAPVAQTARTKS